MFEAALQVAAELPIEWTAYGTRLMRDGARSPWAAPQGQYACPGVEQWLTLSVFDDEQWAALAGVLGDPGWAGDPALATFAGRRVHHDLIDEHLAAWAALTPVEDAVAALLAAGIPAARAFDPRLMSTHPQLVARRFHEAVDHPVVGPRPIAGPPFRYSDVDHWIRTPAPLIGQHNHEVLAEIGLAPDEIAALEAADIVGDRPLGL